MGTLSATMLHMVYSKICVHEILNKQYQEFSGNQYYGTYWPISGQPILTIRDLDLVQRMLGKIGDCKFENNQSEKMFPFPHQSKTLTTSRTGALVGCSGTRALHTTTLSGGLISSLSRVATTGGLSGRPSIRSSHWARWRLCMRQVLHRLPKYEL